MSVIVKSCGGKSSGLYVWEKYNVEFVQGAATTVTLQNDGTSINLYTIDNLYLKDDLTVGIQGDVAKTVAISSLLENTVIGGMNPIYYAYGEDGLVYAYSRCSSDGTAITISNSVTVGKGEFINYVVSDNPNAFPDGNVRSDGFFYEVFDGSGAYVWKKYEYIDSTISMTMTNYGSSGTALVTMTSNDFDITKLNFEDLAGITVNYGTANNKWVLQFVDSSSIILDGNSYGMTWDAENAQMKISANFGAIVTFENFNATVKIFSDYVVSDDPTAYPDGGEQDGYWYEKVVEGISGIDYGTVTLTAQTKTITFAHSLKTVLTRAIVVPIDYTSVGNKQIGAYMTTSPYDGNVYGFPAVLGNNTGMVALNNMVVGSANIGSYFTATNTTVKVTGTTEFCKGTYLVIAVA